MATAYTSILKLALPVQGELSGTWGDVVNDNITSMVEEAIAGRAVINTWTTNSHTLTSADGTTSESRCAMLEFTDTGTALTGDATVVCPAQSKIYICKNDSGQKVTIKTSAGTGVAIADGQTMFVFCDGTNVVEAVTSMSSLKLGTAATSVEVTAVLDEDDLVSDSATALATQQSIKAYVDSQVTAQDLDFAGDTGTGAVDLDSQSLTIAGTTNEIETSASGQTLTVGLPDAVTVTTSVTTPTVQTTNVKANDGTAAVTIADSTGQTTITDAVLTTADINAGTIDNTTIGATTASTGAFTTITSSGNTTVSGSLVTDTIAEETATAGVTVDGVLLKDGGATLTGDLTVDTDTLYVDSTNDRVGVNVAAPDKALDVLSGTANSDVAAFSGTSSGRGLVISTFDDSGSNNDAMVDFDAISGAGQISFSTTTDEAMRIDSSQRVLIGASSSITGYYLQVAENSGYAGVSALRYTNDAFGSYLNLGKSRSTTIGGNTIVQDDDVVGYITFSPNDGTDLVSISSQIQGEIDGTPGANDVPGRLVFKTTADGASSSTERMRISQNGDVDIGQTGGGVKLAVAGAVGPQNGTAIAPTHTFYSDTDTGMYRAAANKLGFATGGANALFIDSSQHVLVGGQTTSVDVGNGTGDIQFGSTNATAYTALRYSSASSGPFIMLGKTRSTTLGTVGTIVQDGDDLGTIRFAGDDGTDVNSWAATVRGEVDGTPGTNDMPGRLLFETTSDGASSSTERMRLNNSGHLAVGFKATIGGGQLTTSPDAVFTVQDSGADLGKVTAVFGADENTNTLTTNTTKEARVGIPHYDLTEEPMALFFATSSSSDNQIILGGGTSRMNAATAVIFRTAANTTTQTGTEVMRINSAQQVLINCTSPRTLSSNPLMQLEGTDAGSAAFSITRSSNDASSGSLRLAKSRNATKGGHTVVQNGDYLGAIYWMGDDGTDDTNFAAGIWAQVDGTPLTGGDGSDMPGRLVFATTADGTNSAVERMRINNRGVVGVNKTPPTITGSVGSALFVGNQSTFQRASTSTYYSTNFYYNSSDVGKSLEAGYSMLYQQDASNRLHAWYSSSQATGADQTVSIAETMRLNDSSLCVSGVNGTFTNSYGSTTRTNLQVDGSSEAIITMSHAGTVAGYFNTNPGSGAMDISAAIGGFRFLPNGSATNKVEIDTNGNIVFPNGQGIDFSASQGSGASSSILDDYEEGKYTVAITTSVSGTVTLNSSYDDASYVKVGNVVHVQGALDVISANSPSGYFKISLPFAAKSSSPIQAYRAAGSVTVYNSVSANIADFVTLLVQGESQFRVYLGDATTMQQDSAEQLDNGSSARIVFQVTYRTA